MPIDELDGGEDAAELLDKLSAGDYGICRYTALEGGAGRNTTRYATTRNSANKIAA